MHAAGNSGNEADAPLVHRSIGPLGRLARVGVGLTFIGLALLWRDPDWQDAVLGLIIAPALVLSVQVGCALFAPVDLVEQGFGARRRGPSTVAE